MSSAGLPTPATSEIRRILSRPGRILTSRLVRFALVGGLATATHGGVLAAATIYADASPLIGNTAGILCSAVVSYCGHRSFTFQSRERHRTASAKFLVQFALSWAITSALAVVLVPWVGKLAASALVVTLSPVFNYFIYSLWTFRATLRPSTAALQRDR